MSDSVATYDKADAGIDLKHPQTPRAKTLSHIEFLKLMQNFGMQRSIS